MKNAAHPGWFVKSEIIEALRLSVMSAAQVLGVTRAAPSAVLNERAHLSPEIALRIEKAFRMSMDMLMPGKGTGRSRSLHSRESRWIQVTVDPTKAIL
jgi:addiction module HigA family antidote